MNAALTRRPTLYGDLEHWALLEAESISLLAQIPDASVDAVVTDPPYAIAFNGKAWDGGRLSDPHGFQAFSTEWASQVRRVLKPGGHVVAFGSPRTFHRLVAGCEDAGLEIRDQLLWLHGRGVPKSRVLSGGISTTLKPAYEPIVLARAPLSERSAEENITRHGTGGLNIDACRIRRPDGGANYWPSHVVLCHQPDCDLGGDCDPGCAVVVVDDATRSGEPLSRLFHAGKTSKQEREAGLDALPHSSEDIFSGTGVQPRANVHPTVKPIDVMRWLIRLTVPAGGLVLDPFTGSGSTGCAAVLEGRRFVGIEREKQYVPIARARLAHWTAQALRGATDTSRDRPLLLP